MKYLLDTHILIWALAASDRLSSKACEVLENMSNTIYFSPISLWEVAIKHNKHPKKMSLSAEQVRDFAEQQGFIELPMRARHGVGIENLPAIHADPFDRMLITQAREDEMILLTHDDLVASYGESILKV